LRHDIARNVKPTNAVVDREMFCLSEDAARDFYRLGLGPSRPRREIKQQLLLA
jgi:hypothetical protein